MTKAIPNITFLKEQSKKLSAPHSDAHELSSDLINYGTDTVLRRLLVSNIALEIAQNIGIDYHAATEELYYYMRKNDRQTQEGILEFINGLYKRVHRKS